MISISAVKKLFQDEDLREVELAYKEFQKGKRVLRNSARRTGKITIDGKERSLEGVEKTMLDKYYPVEETFHSEAKKLGLKLTKYGSLIRDEQSKMKTKSKGGRKPTGRSEKTQRRYELVYEQFMKTKKEHSSWTIREIAEHTSRDKYSGTRYSVATIVDIIKKRKWVRKGYK